MEFMFQPGRQADMYSTMLANNKCSEKKPKNKMSAKKTTKNKPA